MRRADLLFESDSSQYSRKPRLFQHVLGVPEYSGLHGCRLVRPFIDSQRVLVDHVDLQRHRRDDQQPKRQHTAR